MSAPGRGDRQVWSAARGAELGVGPADEWACPGVGGAGPGPARRDGSVSAGVQRTGGNEAARGILLRPASHLASAGGGVPESGEVH